jgi:hypothetical protein
MAMKKTPARRGRERRASERADVRLSMRVEAPSLMGSGKIVTESQNVSASGVYCHASHYLAPLSKVQLTLVLPRMPGAEGALDLVKCEGIVVRCTQGSNAKSETPYELACMFTGIDPSLRRRLEDFVTWRNLQALRAALAPAARKGVAVRKAAPRKPAARKATPARKATSARKPVAKAVTRPAKAKPAARKLTPKSSATPRRTARTPVRKSARQASR